MKALNAKTSQNDIKDDNNFKHKGHIKIQSTNQVEDKNKRVSIIR